MGGGLRTVSVVVMGWLLAVGLAVGGGAWLVGQWLGWW